MDLSPYRHVLLDMNGTFLFGFDAFGESEDFGATYRSLGYDALDAADAHRRIRAAYAHLAARYADPAHYHRFPTLPEALAATADAPLDEAVARELVHAFTLHELGELPPAHAEALHRLAGVRPVSLLSNLWAPHPPWVRRFAEWGIDRVFRSTTFSSEGAAVKPHPTLFAEALRRINAIRTPGSPEVRPAEVVYVGDSYRCDVGGARAAGMDAVYLHGGRDYATAGGQPVGAYPDLVRFSEAAARDTAT